MKHIQGLSLAALMIFALAACDGDAQSGLTIGIDPNNENPDAGGDGGNDNEPDSEPDNGGGRPCGDFLSGETVEEGDLGECGDFQGPCDVKGSAPRVDQVCRDGEVVEVEQMISCDRDTEGLIVEEGEFGECGGFDDECDETGTQTGTATVCENGMETDSEVTRDCERDTDGTLLEEGEFGECGGFDDECDETGTQTRLNAVCVEGVSGGVDETQDCTRDTEGLRVGEGELGECGGFDDVCDETGTQTRTVTVCSEGAATEETESELCTRDTNGFLIEEGELGQCGGFDNECDETGTQEQPVTLCRGGRQVDEIATLDCERDTEGNIVETGTFGECCGFGDDCDENGVRTRTNTVCRDGLRVSEAQTQDCTRNTEGLVVGLGNFTECGGFEGPCDEVGTQTRTLTVCENGQGVQESEESECERPTEGLILTAGDFGACGSFENDCDRNGVQRRDVTICRAGQETDETDRQACTRVTQNCQEGCLQDDGFETNGDFDSAVPMGEGDNQVFLCREAYDDTQETDFYAIDLPAFAQVTLEIEYDHDLIAPLGELFSLLHDPDRQLVDFFQRDGNTNVDKPLRGTFTVPQAQAGVWFLQVDGTLEGVNVPYTVRVIIDIPSCDFDEDIFEPNNSCETATLLPLDLNGCEPGSGGCTCTPQQTCNAPLSCVRGTCQTGFVCGPEADADYYAIDVAAAQTLNIRVPHFHFNGNLDLEVYEPGFLTLAGFSFNVGPDFEEVEVQPTVSGRYCIKIFTTSQLTINSYGIETSVEDHCE